MSVKRGSKFNRMRTDLYNDAYKCVDTYDDATIFNQSHVQIHTYIHTYETYMRTYIHTYIHTIRINIHIPISTHVESDAQIYTVTEEYVVALHAITSAHRTFARKQVQDLAGARNWGKWRVSVSVNVSGMR